ncbi:hypothetical protein RKD37_007991 [Streptomyces ambofaciens]
MDTERECPERPLERVRTGDRAAARSRDVMCGTLPVIARIGVGGSSLRNA